MEKEINNRLEQVIFDYENDVLNYKEASSACDLLQQLGDTDLNKQWANELLLCIKRNQKWVNNKCKYTFLFSIILYIYPDAEIVLEYIKMVSNDDNFTWLNLHFLYYQLIRVLFMNPKSGCYETSKLLWSLHRKIFELCKSVTNYNLERIPENELNGDIQIVLISQFLSPEHGPTKTALDRASVMSKYGKVLIINTADLMSSVGNVPYVYYAIPNYNEKILDQEVVEWKGKKFGYVQCEFNMPDVSTMGILLDYIRKLKPKMCVCIGGASIFAGLVNEMIPTLTVATSQSSIAQTLCDYQIADRYQIELDRKIIYEMDYYEHIIEGKFTFSIKNKEEEFSRNQVGIGEDAFVVSFVGGRLTDEMTDAIWESLNKVAYENIKIIIIGRHNKLNDVISRYPALREKIIDFGFCNDALSRIAISDLYINPVRKGGATSAVEALSLGVPVLTVDYGDVAGTVGEDFICNCVGEYPDIIKKYIHDAEFRLSQRKKAFEVASVLLDSESEFDRVLNEYMKRRKAVL